jgi:hypothetical protein
MPLTDDAQTAGVPTPVTRSSTIVPPGMFPDNCLPKATSSQTQIQ